jgi:hypothetical protein
MEFMPMQERTLWDAKRYAEERAEREGSKFCVRISWQSIENKYFVVPLDPEFESLGGYIYISRAGKLN